MKMPKFDLSVTLRISNSGLSIMFNKQAEDEKKPAAGTVWISGNESTTRWGGVASGFKANSALGPEKLRYTDCRNPNPDPDFDKPLFVPSRAVGGSGGKEADTHTEPSVEDKKKVWWRF